MLAAELRPAGEKFVGNGLFHEVAEYDVVAEARARRVVDQPVHEARVVVRNDGHIVADPDRIRLGLEVENFDFRLARGAEDRLAGLGEREVEFVPSGNAVKGDLPARVRDRYPVLAHGVDSAEKRLVFEDPLGN